MGQPLIASAYRRATLLVASLGFVVFLSLAVLTFHAKRTAFDSWAFRVLPEHITPTRAQFLIGFTEPAISVLVLALTVVLAVSVRRFDLAIVAVVGPVVGTVLASDVAKPIVHRTLFGGTTGSYPSGHQTGVTCTAAVLVLAYGQLPLRRAAKYALDTVLAAWVIIAAVGLTRFYYHYATDTIGAAGLSLAVVFGLALLVDRYRSVPGALRKRASQRLAPPPRAARQPGPLRQPGPPRQPGPLRQPGPPRPAAPARADRPRPYRRPRPPVRVDEPHAQLTPRV